MAYLWKSLMRALFVIDDWVLVYFVDCNCGYKCVSKILAALRNFVSQSAQNISFENIFRNVIWCYWPTNNWMIGEKVCYWFLCVKTNSKNSWNFTRVCVILKKANVKSKVVFQIAWRPEWVILQFTISKWCFAFQHRNGNVLYRGVVGRASRSSTWSDV